MGFKVLFTICFLYLSLRKPAANSIWRCGDYDGSLIHACPGCWLGRMIVATVLAVVWS
jgi:hypothetical protein